jgi:hypothetical protein
MNTEEMQKLVDEGKTEAVSLFHKTMKLHQEACSREDIEAAQITGKMLRAISEFKDVSLDLNGVYGIALGPGGT